MGKARQNFLYWALQNIDLMQGTDRAVMGRLEQIKANPANSSPLSKSSGGLGSWIGLMP